MAHNPEWHRQYRLLEQAENEARVTWRTALNALNRKATPQRQAAHDASLDALRNAGAARWRFEMEATKVVDIATLPAAAWAAAMLPNRSA